MPRLSEAIKQESLWEVLPERMKFYMEQNGLEQKGLGCDDFLEFMRSGCQGLDLARFPNENFLAREAEKHGVLDFRFIRGANKTFPVSRVMSSYSLIRDIILRKDLEIRKICLGNFGYSSLAQIDGMVLAESSLSNEAGTMISEDAIRSGIRSAKNLIEHGYLWQSFPRGNYFVVRTR